MIQANLKSQEKGKGGIDVMMEVITVGSTSLTRLRVSKEYNRVVVLPEGDRWSLKQAEERWYRASVSFAAMATSHLRNSSAVQLVRGWTWIPFLSVSHQGHEIISGPFLCA